MRKARFRTCSNKKARHIKKYGYSRATNTTRVGVTYFAHLLCNVLFCPKRETENNEIEAITIRLVPQIAMHTHTHVRAL